MRSLILVSMIFAGSLAQADAKGKPLPPAQKAVFTAQLTKINVDPKLRVGRVTAATITVNYRDQVATLKLTVDTCPKGVMCLNGKMGIVGAMQRPPIELPIVEVAYDRCNSKIIIAKVDARPVDGGLNELTISDNTNSVCNKSPATNVIYTTDFRSRGATPLETRSTFEGEALK